MVQQLSPMVVVVMAFFILDERLTLRQLLVMVCAFMSVSLVILGGNEDSDALYEANLFSLVMLLLNPIAFSLGIIAMKKMQNTSEWTVTCYVNLTMFAFFTPFVMAEDRSYFNEFFEFGFVFIVLIGLTAIG
jgi:drug/metabolite transporter (DMT)-like permease